MTVLGTQVVIALYDELSYKSAAGIDAGLAMAVTGFSLDAQRAVMPSALIQPDRAHQGAGTGNLDIAGGIDLEMSAETIGFVLRHLLGTPLTSSAAAPPAPPYVHQYRMSTLPAGLLVERDWTTSGLAEVEHFLGCRIDQATFAIARDSPVTLSLDLLGARYALSAAPLVAPLTFNGHGSWYASDVSVLIDDAEISNVINATLTLSNNLDRARYGLGAGGERYDLAEGMCDASATLTALVDADLFATYLDPALDGSPIRLELRLRRGDGSGTAGNEQLRLILPQALLSLTSPPITSPMGLEVSLALEAYGTTQAAAVEAELFSPLPANPLENHLTWFTTADGSYFMAADGAYYGMLH